MKVAEVIVTILESEGITDAFGIPGAGINPVYKYLGESKQIRHYTMRHEEAAVHAADGYYRASGKMALAICTSGPGATNFVTGIYTANIDSIPLIAITGQNVTSLLGKDAFQCVDIAEICKPIAKATWCITSPSEAPAVLREAFRTAKSGKPGPVVIDLPLDVQMAEIDYDLKGCFAHSGSCSGPKRLSGQWICWNRQSPSSSGRRRCSFRCGRGQGLLGIYADSRDHNLYG